MNLDETDRRLLGVIERSVPLKAGPYAIIGQTAGLEESQVLARLAELRRPDGPIRQISGVFEAAALGYAQTLVAMSIPPDLLDRAGEAAAGHPGVSHCYARTGFYNLWFTLAVSPESALGLARTAEIIGRSCRAEQTLLLPAIRRYKLSARFMSDTGEAGPARPDQRDGQDNPPGPESSAAPSGKTRPSPGQTAAIRLLQADLPNVPRPFESLAGPAGTAEKQLLDSARDFIRRGWMRRYCAMLRHRAVGMNANVLAAWRAPDETADFTGAAFSLSRHISHCYLRPASPDWPYNLYTMIHGRTRDDCQNAIAELARTSGLKDRAELWTEKEYRKARVELFSPLEKQWEIRHANPP
ncbi:MAG: Lrp/AsnC family transcriptional regulator [Planctomycetes bacterium]|nr:Lrp/AsnC family transcriptional regulator [Planctomycetota bacterium]